MMKRIQFFLIFIFIGKLNALVVGSNSVVSREAHATFPSEDSNNEMLGFGWFENGFTLSHYAVTCTFNSVYPVSGKVNLRGATLFLQQDLKFSDTVEIDSIGSIFGNNHALEIGSGVTEFSKGAGIIGGKFFDPVTESPDLTANVRSVDWSFDGSYVAAGVNARVDDHMLQIFYFDGNSLTLTASYDMDVSNGSGDAVFSVRWHPSAHFLAAGKQDSGSGGLDLSVFKYNTSLGSFAPTFNLEDRAVRAVSWQPTGSWLSVGRVGTAGSAEVQIWSFTEATGELTGVRENNLTGNRNVRHNAIDWSPTGSYFAVGMNNDVTAGEAELLVYYFDGLSLTLTVSVDIAANVQGVDWSPSGTFIAIGLNSTSERLRVFSHRAWNGTLVENVSAQVGESTLVQSVHWSNDGNRLLVGANASGGDDEIFIYTFNKSTAVLTNDRSVEKGVNVRTVRFSDDNTYVAVGSDDFLVTIYTTARPDPIFNNLNFLFNNDLTLSTTLKFSGSCFLDGQNHVLTLASSGLIQAQSGAQLTLENVRINNLQGNNLCCIDDNSSIIFKNSSLVLSSDFSFTKGGMRFELDNSIIGTNKFAYQSIMTTTIASQARLVLENGITFSYDPASTQNNLIEMTDITSEWFINGGTLYVTGTGLALSKGTLLLDRKVTLFAEGLTKDTGLIFGDGTSAGDLVVGILPAAQVEASGFIVNKTID